MTSVAVSMTALPLRRIIGVPGLLLLAFGMQVALTTALAFSSSLFVIALFAAADGTGLAVATLHPGPYPAAFAGRAGRLVFAATLSLAAAHSSALTGMPYVAVLGALAARPAAQGFRTLSA